MLTCMYELVVLYMYELNGKIYGNTVHVYT